MFSVVSNRQKLYNLHEQKGLIKEKGLKPVTVCIAAICDAFGDYQQKIVCFADRLASSWIQFESATPKIKKITDYCYTLQSSNNSLASDLILERVKKTVEDTDNPMTIEEIVNTLKNESTKSMYHT